MRPTDLWDTMEGVADDDAANDSDLRREPFHVERKCWVEDDDDQRWPIDFVVLDPKAWALVRPQSFEKFGMQSLSPTGTTWTKALDGERLSDHCPLRIALQ